MLVLMSPLLIQHRYACTSSSNREVVAYLTNNEA